MKWDIKINYNQTTTQCLNHIQFASDPRRTKKAKVYNIVKKAKELCPNTKIKIEN